MTKAALRSPSPARYSASQMREPDGVETANDAAPNDEQAAKERKMRRPRNGQGDGPAKPKELQEIIIICFYPSGPRQSQPEIER